MASYYSKASDFAELSSDRTAEDASEDKSACRGSRDSGLSRIERIELYIDRAL